ncbi:MAG: helix-turn-helix domain containing protein [Candidatus Accumulibacter sp.]|jgi:hypothetical protein|nr:helix-turn-helix domain containing protein [Accumulibacter sp.]
MKVRELLDSVKKIKGIKTDYALAKELEIHQWLISCYYDESRIPNEFACLQIAKALGKSYEEISACIHAQTEKNEKRRAVWRDFYQQIGGIAAGVTAFILSIYDVIQWNAA